MWCWTVSLFLKATASPALAATGFGENAVDPAEPTIETVTVCGDGAGVGEGVGVGAGDGVGEVGTEGVLDGLAPP
jgi:hypothetical protein